jgi:hypothetical protein
MTFLDAVPQSQPPRIAHVPDEAVGDESNSEDDLGPLLDPSGGPDEPDPDFDPPAAIIMRPQFPASPCLEGSLTPLC